MKYRSSNSGCSIGISKVKVFKKKWMKLQGQGHRVKLYGIHGRSAHKNTHVKYRCSINHCSKVISKVQVSERRTE